MRRSFGGGGGGMGGGSGGGGMLRTVQRTLRAGVGGGATPEPFSHCADSTTANSRKPRNFSKKMSNPPNTALTLSSSSGGGGNSGGSSAFSSLVNLPYSGASGVAAPGWGSCSSPTCSEDMEWECVDGAEDGKARVFYEDFVFESVPSSDEVNHAVSALQQVLGPSFYPGVAKERFSEDSDKDTAYEVTTPTSFRKSISSDSETDWFEPSLHLCNSRSLQTHGSDRVYDAFHLLQTEPSVQRMVISLSSDKAVWDAVLNNDIVKELRGSIEADNQRLEREIADEGSGDSNPVKDIMSWVFVNAKDKITQLIDKIAKLVTEVFQPPNEDKKGGTMNSLEERLKTSLFLSIVVLLIVVVTRAQST